MTTTNTKKIVGFTLPLFCHPTFHFHPPLSHKRELGHEFRHHQLASNASNIDRQEILQCRDAAQGYIILIYNTVQSNKSKTNVLVAFTYISVTLTYPHSEHAE